MSLSASSQLGQVLGEGLKDNSTTKQNISADESEGLAQINSGITVIPRFNALRVYDRNVAADTLWDFDAWDVGTWEGDYAESAAVVAVYNPDGAFYELFQSSQFIADSTGFTISNGAIASTSTEATLLSKIIRWDGTTFTQAKLTLDGSDTVGGTIYLSADDGTTWDSTNSGSWKTLTTPGTKLRYKILTNGSGAWGVWGVWGSLASDLNLSRIRVDAR